MMPYQDMKDTSLLQPHATSTPTFAVVIPLYNHGKYIGPALQSVLDQSHPVDEIILIDDGSRDDGPVIAQDMLRNFPNATVRIQANAGAHTTINRCIGLARSEFVAVLNSDDIFHKDKIAYCVERIRENMAIDLIIGDVGIIDPEGRAVSSGETVDWLDRAHLFFKTTGLLSLSLLHENFAVTTSNMVFRKSLWERNGGFQPLRYCHDSDFLAASARNGTICYDAGREHISYRVHPTNTIKESLARIRVEIAAVMTTALIENGMQLTDGRIDPSSNEALVEMIRAKGMSELVLMLARTYSSYPDRSSFYDAVTTPRLSALYQSVLTGEPVAAEFAVDSTVPPATKSLSVPSAHSQAAEICVAIEVTAFDKGGLEKVVLDSAILFRQRGIRPLVISVGPVGHLGTIAAAHEIEVVRLPTTGREVFYESLLRVRGVDLAMSHFSGVGYPVFKRLGIPNITFIHNVYAMMSGEVLENFKHNDDYVDRYISVSPKATRYSVHRLGVAEEKVITIPNGLILEEHEQRAKKAQPFDRKELGLAESDFIFLNVASYNLHKAHYLMAQALQIVCQKRSDIKVVCVGNEIYPPHVRELKQYILDHKLQGHMILPGYYDDVAPLHLMSDAFILPSFIEGWSIAMNEAMYYGKPMILSDTGGSSEVIDQEDIGILVPNEYGDVLNLDSALLDRIAYSPQDYKTAPLLAAAMIRFADQRLAWSKAGKRGHQKVVEQYDFSTVVDRYIAEIRAGTLLRR